MKTLSYNLRKNRAVGELDGLVGEHDVDILCLQEAETVTLPEEIRHMRLVHATAQNRLGLAMYVRESRFDVRDVNTFQLKKSLHDRVLAPAHERLLGARLYDSLRGHEVVAATFHAAPLTASNRLRRHQISSAHRELEMMGPGLPLLMIGDFNYPFFQKNLISNLKNTGHAASMSKDVTYKRYYLFTGVYDFVTTKNFNLQSVTSLGQGVSDHKPILVVEKSTELSKSSI